MDLMTAVNTFEKFANQDRNIFLTRDLDLKEEALNHHLN